MADGERELDLRLGDSAETRRIEFKGPGRAGDSYHLAKVTRAALSMGNMRDGGYVVIGVDDDKTAELQPGLSASDLATWLDADDVAQKMDKYADPALQFTVKAQVLRSGVTVAVVRVSEFEDLPHICAKQYVVPGNGKDREVLRKGAIYVRPRHMPQSSEVASSIEMRELLDLATEKSLRNLLGRIGRAGGDVVVAYDDGGQHEQRFEQERSEAWSDDDA